MKEKTKFVAFSTQKGGAGKTTLTVLAASYLHYVKGFNVAVIDCDYPQHSIVEMRERDLKMKEKTKFVAFSTQKGGAGKTTLTVLAASYLHYVKGFNVAVIDCDYPQHSIVEMRERDLKLALEDEHYKRLAYEQFTRLQKKAYPVVESNTKEALADADYLLPQGDFDYVFFDLPGTINNEDLIHSLAGMDYLVAPISADRVVMESTLNYAVVVKEHIMGREKSRMKGLYMLWNMVDGREKTELYQVYEAVMKELDLPVLKTFLPDTKRFRREQNASRRSVIPDERAVYAMEHGGRT
ncbi:AAA family ATPase [Bacteroides faecis]|nr:AAA family ATPase [Bacteroides faecis]